MAVRIQIACDGRLVAECIVTDMWEADRIWAAYCRLKYERAKPMGGCTMQNANKTRYWNVSIGGRVR
jgi:hypothetical protein